MSGSIRAQAGTWSRSITISCRSYGLLAGGQEVEWLFHPPIQPRRIKMSTFDQTDAPAGSEYATVHMAFELSKANWKIGVLLPGSPKMSRFTVEGGDVTALL